jgi:hypothetical protein
MKHFKISVYRNVTIRNHDDPSIKTYKRSYKKADEDIGYLLNMTDTAYNAVMSQDDLNKIRVYNESLKDHYDTFIVSRTAMPKVQDRCNACIIKLILSCNGQPSRDITDSIIQISALCNLLQIVYKSRGSFFLELISANT